MCASLSQVCLHASPVPSRASGQWGRHCCYCRSACSCSEAVCLAALSRKWPCARAGLTGSGHARHARRRVRERALPALSRADWQEIVGTRIRPTAAQLAHTPLLVVPGRVTAALQPKRSTPRVCPLAERRNAVHYQLPVGYATYAADQQWTVPMRPRRCALTFWFAQLAPHSTSDCGAPLRLCAAYFRASVKVLALLGGGRSHSQGRL